MSTLKAGGVYCPGNPPWKALWRGQGRGQRPECCKCEWLLNEEGGRWAGMRIQCSWCAHLCYNTNAFHDDWGFGLSPTHSAQSRGNKNFPSQVIDAQVPTTSIQQGELQGEELGAHCPLRACQPPIPWGQAWPLPLTTVPWTIPWGPM